MNLVFTKTSFIKENLYFENISVLIYNKKYK